MTKLDFPDTPTTGQQYGSSGTVWRWDGMRWASTAGASGARGQVAYAVNVVGQTGFTGTIAAISDCAVAFNTKADRTYKVSAETLVSGSVGGAAESALMFIANSAGTQLQSCIQQIWTAGQLHKMKCEVILKPGDVTGFVAKMMLYRNSGTGTLTVTAGVSYPTFISVEDITYEAGSTPPADPNKPWNTAWGYIGQAKDTNNYTNITTEAAIVTGSVNVVLGRRYSANTVYATSVTTAGAAVIGTTKLGGVPMSYRMNAYTNGSWHIENFPGDIYQAVATGTIPITTTLRLVTGGGSCSSGGAAWIASSIAVYDIGPVTPI